MTTAEKRAAKVAVKTKLPATCSKPVAAPAPEPRVLLLRGNGPGGAAHEGFVWPTEIGAVVRPVSWDPQPVCGGGLHGLLWGEGAVGALMPGAALWIVFSAAESDVVQITSDGPVKAKAREARVEFVSASREEAATWLSERAPGHTVHFATRTAGDSGTATAGHYGTATAGHDGTATAGHDGTATAGHDGTATAGHCGTIAIRYWNNETQRYRMRVAEVGADGIEPDVAYRMDAKGRFVRAEPAK